MAPRPELMLDYAEAQIRQILVSLRQLSNQTTLAILSLDDLRRALIPHPKPKPKEPRP